MLSQNNKNDWALGGLLAVLVVSVWALFALAPAPPLREAENSQAHQQAAQRSEGVTPAISPEERRIADYTQALAWFTGLLVLVSCIQLIALFRADATAREAGRNFRQVERAQVFLRTYVISVRAFDTGARHAQLWRVVPILKNSGNTPTRQGLLTVCSIDQPQELPEDFDFDSNHIFRNVPMFIGAGGEISCGTIEMSPIDLEKVWRRKTHAYVWGWIDYNDAFEGSPRHRTEFCHELTVIGDPSTPDPMHLRFDTYRKHNGADDDCVHQPAPYA